VSITSSQEAVNGSINVNMDPTVPAPMINVAEYGFEGRFEDWADDARYFEYSQAANPIGSGFTPKVPVVRFSPEIYVDEPTGIVPLDLSKELGITTGEAPILGDRTVFNSRVEPRTNADVRAELGLHIGPRRR
jgi:hypothetical protein